MATRTPTPRRKGGGRPKIDWAAAFVWYAANPDASYRDVGEKFGVSDCAVGKHARAEDWPTRAAAIRGRAAARAEDAAVRTLEERQRETVQVANRLRAVALDKDAEIDLELAVRMLPAYAKLEQLFAGEATDRVAIDEVRSVIVQVVQVAGRFVAAEQRPAFLAALEQATGGLTALEAEPA